MIDHEDRQVVTVPRWMMHACGGDPRDAMVLAQVAFWYQPPLDGSREHRATHTIHRLDADWLVVVDQDIADQLGMTRSQVQRARSALSKRGLIATRTSKVDGERRTLVRPVIAGKRESAHSEPSTLDLCAETRNGSMRESAHTRAGATPPSRDQCGDQEPLAADAAGGGAMFGADAGKATDPVKDAADVLTRRVFDERSPKPTTKYVAVRALIERFLRAGHDPERLRVALMADGPFTDAGVEFRIARIKERAPGAPIIEDRTGPTGRLSKDEIRRIAG